MGYVLLRFVCLCVCLFLCFQDYVENVGVFSKLGMFAYVSAMLRIRLF